MVDKLSRANLGSILELPVGTADPAGQIEVSIAGFPFRVSISDLTGVAQIGFGQVDCGADTILATVPNDVLNVEAGSNITFDVDLPTKRVRINSTGAAGATNLDGLSDVAVSAPATGQTIRWNGSTFVNATLGQDDISGLVAALAGKSDSAHLHTGIYAPITHPHQTSDIQGLGTAALANLPAAGQDASAGEVVRGDDTRITTAWTLTGYPHVHPLSQIAAGTPDRLVGRDGQGNTSEITATAPLVISNGAISVTLPPAVVSFQSNGTPIGTSATLNVTGAGQALTMVSGIATLNIPGGGGGGGALPPGGSTGQRLAKISGADGDAGWITDPVAERRHLVMNDALSGFANRANLVFDGFGIADEPTNDATRITPLEDGDAPIKVQFPADTPVSGTWTPNFDGNAIAFCEIADPAPATLTINPPATPLGGQGRMIVKTARVRNSKSVVLTLAFNAAGPQGFAIGGDLTTPDLTLDAGQTRDFPAWNEGGNWFYGVVTGTGGGSSPVSSVFGRTGVVAAVSGDYTAAQVTETSIAKIMTGTERTKLAGIEDGATADQTGGEIVTAINSALGGPGWQGGSGQATLPFYADFDCGTFVTPALTAVKDPYGIQYSSAPTFTNIDLGTFTIPAEIDITLGAF